MGKEAINEEFFVSFIDFEISQREFDRTRTLFEYSLQKLPIESQDKLQRALVSFEKMYGSRENIEKVIFAKRRLFYEKEIEKDPSNYDTWFDYLRLEEEQGAVARVRELFERSVAQLPLKEEKSYWRRYVFLWIKYAVFEELTAADILRAETVYKKALEVVPHAKFTFAKLWIQFAFLQVRKQDVDSARKVFGTAIGKCPKPKVYF